VQTHLREHDGLPGVPVDRYADCCYLMTCQIAPPCMQLACHVPGHSVVDLRLCMSLIHGVLCVCGSRSSAAVLGLG
jgi:hypothetical protein